jgi:hypothetical protein
VNIANFLFIPAFNFIKLNYQIIIFTIIIASFFYLGFWITTLSLKKLKVGVFSYYPFDRFFPQSGKWSVLYFLITTILLGVLVYFLSKGGFYMAPA